MYDSNFRIIQDAAPSLDDHKQGSGGSVTSVSSTWVFPELKSLQDPQAIHIYLHHCKQLVNIHVDLAVVLYEIERIVLRPHFNKDMQTMP